MTAVQTSLEIRATIETMTAQQRAESVAAEAAREERRKGAAQIHDMTGKARDAWDKLGDKAAQHDRAAESLADVIEAERANLHHAVARELADEVGAIGPRPDVEALMREVAQDARAKMEEIEATADAYDAGILDIHSRAIRALGTTTANLSRCGLKAERDVMGQEVVTLHDVEYRPVYFHVTSSTLADAFDLLTREAAEAVARETALPPEAEREAHRARVQGLLAAGQPVPQSILNMLDTPQPAPTYPASKFAGMLAGAVTR
ncbi:MULTISPECIES: hypothetical protein [Glutamicibacter]|uniref:hypothetical protein n=1 Tax=Glutamicibacter TaxID=1742989 RepID=UPI003325A729